ncbi:MAG: hypothetical protein DRP70_06660 [Spirochaetes bacterium]|nr:MAG: hypothetical protein DRP49_04010 [Spirochaetota bacterium]RKX88387.1 MAG: hypothetical protein DRP70_06660 [Spirochaetota bacterium]
MFDRKKIQFSSLSTRENKVSIEKDFVSTDDTPAVLPAETSDLIKQISGEIREARRIDAPVILAFGAHTIKNGMSPVLRTMINKNYITHLATNGAGIIHDWEFAFQGKSSEDVRSNVNKGQFGIWEETGYYLNLAIAVGAYEGKGYGESIGSMVLNDGLMIPEISILKSEITRILDSNPAQAAAAADLLSLIVDFSIKPGFLTIKHRYKEFGLQSEAFRLGVPFTGHPMFGHDIIYTHPVNCGAAIGRTAERDFLKYAESVSRLEGGVYLSVGSAVMSPMIFEKSLSMAQNVWLQQGKKIENHKIYVVDLAKSSWDWTRGEPPSTDPAYYLRFLKTFNRMGGSMNYISADNRDFLLTLYQELEMAEPI